MRPNGASDLGFRGFVLAAPHSGSGKTTLAVGFMRALRNRGFRVQPFKCGPDYIDPAYHVRAAGRASVNLDTWMMGKGEVVDAYRRYAADADVAVVEGVMGLFDGAEPGELEGSTADCARLLGLPVLLVVDAKGLAGSIAPLVAGFARFHPEVRICGVLANRVGSESHAAILRSALASAGLPPLLGALPRNETWTIGERHLGLVPECENPEADGFLSALADGIEEHIDIDAVLDSAVCPRPPGVPDAVFPDSVATVAIADDSAFHFYYPENLRLLRSAGFEIVRFSPCSDSSLPAGTDVLYLGGGFPEVFAKELSGNAGMRRSICDFVAGGGAVYAECGGFMYLCREIVTRDGAAFPMAGVLDGRACMGERLRSLGYRCVETLASGLLGPAGTRVRGHEFHWSEVEWNEDPESLFLSTGRRGLAGPTGCRFRNVFASYIHLYFGSNLKVADNWRRFVKGDEE